MGCMPLYNCYQRMKKLIVFDLDGTLAESKAAIDAEMAKLFSQLLDVAKVAIISGGDWPQFDKQVIAHLHKDAKLNKLSILPTCGTKFYQYGADGWKKLYSENFTDAEKKTIIDSLNRAVEESGFKVEKVWGDQIEDRESQITFSALGQQAPLNPKKAWDPDFAKRKKIQELLNKAIPEFSVQLGGATSIDITKPGIDKAYGIRKLRDVLCISIDDMLFIGDALFKGGNDYPASTTGAKCIQTKDPEETKHLIDTIVTFLLN
jgi:phosphomannomutase